MTEYWPEEHWDDGQPEPLTAEQVAEDEAAELQDRLADAGAYGTEEPW